MKKLCPHLLFVLAAAACVYLPLLAMLIVREGPVSFVLFCFPPITSIPLFAWGLGAGAGKNVRRYWYVPALVSLCFFLSLYGRVLLTEMLLKLLALYLLLGAGGMLLCYFIRKFIGLKPGEAPHEKDMV